MPLGETPTEQNLGGREERAIDPPVSDFALRRSEEHEPICAKKKPFRWEELAPIA